MEKHIKTSSYIQEGDYYVRTESKHNIEFQIFNDNYKDAITYCYKKHIDPIKIKRFGFIKVKGVFKKVFKD